MSIDKSQELFKNNFYASFIDVNKLRIKEVFEKNGWDCRKAGWVDYELTNSWSELTLEGEENEPLLNGMISFNQNSIKILDKIFTGLGGHFIYELYDNQKNLTLEKKNGI